MRVKKDTFVQLISNAKKAINKINKKVKKFRFDDENDKPCHSQIV